MPFPEEDQRRFALVSQNYRLVGAIRDVLKYIDNYDGQPNPLSWIEEKLSDALTPEER